MPAALMRVSFQPSRVLHQHIFAALKHSCSVSPSAQTIAPGPENIFYGLNIFPR